MENTQPTEPTTAALPRRKYRTGTTIRLTRKELLDALYAPQGITVCRLADLPPDVEIQSVVWHPGRRELEILIEPIWPTDAPPTETDDDARGNERLRLFWLHDNQEALEQDLRNEHVLLNRTTPESALRSLIDDPVIGPELRLLAERVVALLP